MKDFIPPRIPPAVSNKMSWKLLKLAIKNPAYSWPKEIYNDQYYRPPMGRILYVMEEKAIEEVLVTRVEEFVQSSISQRILNPVWGDGLFNANGKEWRAQRKTMAPIFTPNSSTAAIAPAQRAANQEALEGVSTSIELTSSMARVATDVLFDVFLAGGRDEALAYGKAAHELTEGMTTFNLADVFQLPMWTRKFLGQTLDGPGGKLHAISDRILRAHKTSTPLLDRLKTAQDPESGETMSHDKVRDNLVGMLAAGRETTAIVLAFSVWLLSQHEPSQERLIAEIKAASLPDMLDLEAIERVPFARQVVMEAMRLYPPLYQMARDVLHDTEICGQKVSRGTVVLVPTYALQRRSDFWEKPDVFDPDRFEQGKFDARKARYRFLPFGVGPRICLGMNFALYEIMSAIITIVRGYELKPVGPDPTLGTGLTLTSMNGLNVQMVSREIQL